MTCFQSIYENQQHLSIHTERCIHTEVYILKDILSHWKTEFLLSLSSHLSKKHKYPNKGKTFQHNHEEHFFLPHDHLPNLKIKFLSFNKATKRVTIFKIILPPSQNYQLFMKHVLSLKVIHFIYEPKLSKVQHRTQVQYMILQIFFYPQSHLPITTLCEHLFCRSTNSIKNFVMGKVKISLLHTGNLRQN